MGNLMMKKFSGKPTQIQWNQIRFNSWHPCQE